MENKYGVIPVLTSLTSPYDGQSPSLDTYSLEMQKLANASMTYSSAFHEAVGATPLSEKTSNEIDLHLLAQAEQQMLNPSSFQQVMFFFFLKKKRLQF